MSQYDINKAKRAIAGIESGGDYSIYGPQQGNGDRAIGKYQVMASNIPSWSQAALGRQITPEEFRNNPDLQEKIFEHRFGGYMDQYGPAGASSMWFSGSPNTGSSSTDSLGTSVPTYVSKFMKAYDGSSSDPVTIPQQQQVVTNSSEIPSSVPLIQTVSLQPPSDNSDQQRYASLIQAATSQPQQQYKPISGSPIIQAATVNNEQEQQPQQGILSMLYSNKKKRV